MDSLTSTVCRSTGQVMLLSMWHALLAYCIVSMRSCRIFHSVVEGRGSEFWKEFGNARSVLVELRKCAWKREWKGGSSG